MPPKSVTPALNDAQAEAVALIEQTFWEHGSVPTAEFLSEKLGLNTQTITKYFNNPVFRDALVRRGVDLRQDSSRAILTPKQLLLVNMMLNQHDRRSIREKLELAEVSSQQYYAWLKNPAFKTYLARRAEDLFSSSDHEGYLSLLEVVRGGDVQGLKLFFEMRGKYTPKSQLDVNVESVIVRIVEIIGKHVQDPSILNKIANDIDVSIGLSPPRAALPSGNNGDGLEI